MFYKDYDKSVVIVKKFIYKKDYIISHSLFLKNLRHLLKVSVRENWLRLAYLLISRISNPASSDNVITLRQS